MNKRLIIKGLIWEVLGVITLFIITRDLELSLAYIVVRSVMYYYYHLLWKKTGWLK